MKDHVTDQLNISIQEFCILSLGWFEENIALIVLAQIILIILMQNS